MVSDPNEATDNFLHKAEATYAKLRAEGRAPPGKRIVRGYAASAETAIKLRQVKSLLEKKDKLPPEDMDVFELSGLDAIIRRILRHEVNGQAAERQFQAERASHHC